VPVDAPFCPEDTFVHGIIHGEGGTCASLPVVYVAVGRRLCYPLKLVEAKGEKDLYGHQFCRWDDPNGERFNIEINKTGLDCPPDDYYRTGQFFVSPELEKAGCFLKAATPKEELAGFLVERGCCWRDHRRFRRGAESFAWAHVLAPYNGFHLYTLKANLNSWTREMKRRQPRWFPEIYIGAPERRYPSVLPLEIERDILGLEATENLLHNPEHEHDWWGPMRKGRIPARRPVKALVDFKGTQCHVSFRFADTSFAYSFTSGDTHV
jgi:hypothetical protein